MTNDETIRHFSNIEFRRLSRVLYKLAARLDHVAHQDGNFCPRRPRYRRSIHLTFAFLLSRGSNNFFGIIRRYLKSLICTRAAKSKIFAGFRIKEADVTRLITLTSIH